MRALLLQAPARVAADSARIAREPRLRLLQRWRDEGIRTAAEPAQPRAGPAPPDPAPMP